MYCDLDLLIMRLHWQFCMAIVAGGERKRKLCKNERKMGKKSELVLPTLKQYLENVISRMVTMRKYTPTSFACEKKTAQEEWNKMLV